MSPATIHAIEGVRLVLEAKASRTFLDRAISTLEDAGGDPDSVREAVFKVGKMAALFIGEIEAEQIRALVPRGH